MAALRPLDRVGSGSDRAAGRRRRCVQRRDRAGARGARGGRPPPVAAPAREPDRPDPPRPRDPDHVLPRRGGDLPAVGRRSHAAARGARAGRARRKLRAPVADRHRGPPAAGLPDRPAALAPLAARAVEHRRRAGAGHGRHRTGPRTPRLGDARRRRQSTGGRRHGRRRPPCALERRRGGLPAPHPHRVRGARHPRAALVGRGTPTAQVDRARARHRARRPRAGRVRRHVRVGAGGQRRLVGVHGGADRRHAASRSGWRSFATGSTTSTW